VLGSTKALSFASCHLEGEDMARSAHMSFSPVGVLHAAQHQLHQNLRENQDDARGTFLYVCCFCLYFEERIRG